MKHQIPKTEHYPLAPEIPKMEQRWHLEEILKMAHYPLPLHVALMGGDSGLRVNFYGHSHHPLYCIFKIKFSRLEFYGTQFFFEKMPRFWRILKCRIILEKRSILIALNGFRLIDFELLIQFALNSPKQLFFIEKKNHEKFQKSSTQKSIVLTFTAVLRKDFSKKNHSFKIFGTEGFAVLWVKISGLVEFCTPPLALCLLQIPLVLKGRPGPGADMNQIFWGANFLILDFIYC